VYFIFHRNLDQRIGHEIDNVVSTILVQDGSITVKDSSELNEPDFATLTQTPYFLQIFDNDGNLILKSKNIDLYKAIPFQPSDKSEDLFFESLSFDEERYRCGYRKIFDENGIRVATLQIAVFEKNFKAVMSELVYFNLIAILIFLITIIIASVIAAKKAFKPINEIINTAQSYNVQNLNKRIEVDAKPSDEIGRLRDTLNSLFTRLENYVVEITQFSDHVSHQLMNPLTAIRTEIEYLIKKDRPAEEYKEALSKLSVQTDTMISIVKTLLVIAKSGKVKNESKTIFSLSKLIKNDVCNFFKDYSISYEVDENLYLRGESEKYLMVLQNLIHNSIKYSPNGGDIKVTASKYNSGIIISVEDNGIGIDDLDKESVFQKFYRSSQAEKLGIKGFGLGLSLVKSIIDEASGTIEISDNKPSGTIFRILLPSIDLAD
jgi:signal transduction histidine kinase